LSDEECKSLLCTEKSVHVFAETEKGFTGDNRHDPPTDWCHMKLKHLSSDPRVDDTWDYCYCGCPPKNALPILKTHVLLPGNRMPGTSLGDLVCDGLSDAINDDKHIYTSPSIHYASHYAYACPEKWVYKEKTYYVRVVFQVKQKRNTHKVERTTLVSSCWDPTVAFDNSFKNEEIEWTSEDPSSICVEAILLHFSDIPVEELVKKREDSRRGVHVETPMKMERDNFQQNLKETKLMILWVDDHPENNESLVKIIEECGVKCVCRPDTDSALRELRDHHSRFFAVFTDLVRTEKREKDDSPQPYYKAGIDLIKSMREMAICLPVYMYSSWCRSSTELCTEVLDAGAAKICNYDDIVFLIRRE